MPWTVAAFGVSAALPGLAGSPLLLGAALFALGATAGAMDVATDAAGSAEESVGGP